ncbi:hypothetical protein GJ700_11175 [Duganella sp. FT92W]|uniref:Phage protein n=1 Tax=Pseudoduganella rivuli TaxID=2666085 RepID=A0A7X2ILL7_9BURK|nr:hypothetical protein [Pseudoduganella rivuli]MRV72276.1 hypothetical protein [Pseudoduganella rivuli]
MADQLHNLDQLHEAIRTGLAARLADVPSVFCYPADEGALALPAILIDLVRLAPGRDPGSGELGLRAHFQARIVVDATAPGAALQARGLAARIALALRNENWGLRIGAAQLGGAAADAVQPSGRLAWLLEWTHDIELGEPAWPYPDSTGVALMLGLEPETGPGHESDYWQAGG